eukprot:2166427-Amphidinium_carterae.1
MVLPGSKPMKSTNLPASIDVGAAPSSQKMAQLPSWSFTLLPWKTYRPLYFRSGCPTDSSWPLMRLYQRGMSPSSI